MNPFISSDHIHLIQKTVHIMHSPNGAKMKPELNNIQSA